MNRETLRNRYFNMKPVYRIKDNKPFLIIEIKTLKSNIAIVIYKHKKQDGIFGRTRIKDLISFTKTYK